MSDAKKSGSGSFLKLVLILLVLAVVLLFVLNQMGGEDTVPFNYGGAGG